MPQYRIVEWDERYEVDDKGRDLVPGRTKRKGPLVFIRLKVHGRSQGVGWRKLLKKAGQSKALTVFGCFCKLLEIAGDDDRDHRNVLPSLDDEEGVAFLLDVPSVQVEFSLKILEGIGWIEVIPGDSPEFPGNSGLSTTNQPTNTTQPTQHNTTHWAALRERVRGVVGGDGGVEAALTVIGNSLMSDPAQAEEVAEIIIGLLPACRKPKVKNKPSYLLGALRKRFPCVDGVLNG